MIFDKSLDLADISLALTAVCARGDVPHRELDKIRDDLKTYTHETIFERAEHHANTFNQTLVVKRAVSFEDLRHVAAFVIHSHNDVLICGLYTGGDDNSVMYPPKYQGLLPKEVAVMDAIVNKPIQLN